MFETFRKTALDSHLHRVALAAVIAGFLALAAAIPGIARAQDYVPPPAVTDLEASPTEDQVVLRFTMPGDACTNAKCGTYVVKYSSIPMTNENFENQNTMAVMSCSDPGTFECFISPELLNCGVTYRVALKVRDTTGNWSSMSNQVTFTTRDCCPGGCPDPFCVD